MRQLRVLGFGVAMILTAGLGIASILAGAGVLSLLSIWVNAALFHHEGEWGRIDLSPIAIKEFIAGILRKDFGLDRFRILLRHQVNGVGITVRTTLSPGQCVTDVGERIQRELTEQVADRTGVDVSNVTVLVRSIRASDSRIEETSSDETDT